MNFADVRDGLAVRLETLDTFLAVYPFVPDSVVAPSAAVIPGDPFATYHTTSAGTGGQMIRLQFDIIVFAQRYSTAHGQDVLDGLVGTVPDALEADQTLAGAASVVVVREGTNYGVVTVADTTYSGCRFAVEVYGR